MPEKTGESKETSKESLNHLNKLLNHPQPKPRPPRRAVPREPAAGARNFVCPEAGCDRNFRRNEHLARHLTTHSGEKAFRCDLCQMSFNRSDGLGQHERTQKHLEMTLFRGLDTRDISLKNVVDMLHNPPSSSSSFFCGDSFFLGFFKL